MKFQIVFLLLIPAFACAQTPPPGAVPADTVVAKIGDRPLTAREVKALLDSLPADMRDQVLANPAVALRSYAVMEYLRREAQKQNLAALSPYKEQLDLQQRQILSSAAMAHHAESIVITDDEARKQYEDDKLKYRIAKVRAIMIGFEDPKNPLPPPAEGEKPQKVPTEAEAKAKAEDLAKKARAGADFAELARKYSDEKISAAKGGDMGVAHYSDTMPEEARMAMFIQQPGGVIDPFIVAGNYFVVQVQETGYSSFEEVREKILVEMKTARQQAWMSSLQKQYEVTILNESFFPKPPRPATPPGQQFPGSVTVK